MAKQNRQPSESGDIGPEDHQPGDVEGGADRKWRRLVAILDEPFGQTMFVECHADDEFPALVDVIPTPVDGLEEFAQAAIELVYSTITMWYNVPEGVESSFKYSLWTTRDERASGTIVLCMVDLGEHGSFFSMVAPPGPPPEHDTTGVWIARDEGDDDLDEDLDEHDDQSDDGGESDDESDVGDGPEDKDA